MAVCYKTGHFNDNWKVFPNIWLIAIFFFPVFIQMFGNM